MDYIQPNEFGFGTALALVNSTDPFPVEFDAAWQWLGYQRKDYAKETLVRNFERGLDYTSEFSGLNRKTPEGGRPSESIYLTIDCFKSFCMMAGTEKGKEVRNYFLECERQLKQAISPTIAPREQKYLPSVDRTIPNWQYLLTFLRSNRHKKFTVEELAQELNMKEKSVHRFLLVMYRQGFVERECNPNPAKSVSEYLYWGVLLRKRTRST